MGIALRFISGKYQGGEFPLEHDQEIIVGRSSDLDMVLVEEMVSRKHARIRVAGSQITIEDLGSTNGTFVNGEKIQSAQLREGDRVLIGTSILKLVTSERGGGEGRVFDSTARRAVANVQRTTEESAPRMAGSLEEIPLPDLLQLFGTSRKTATLVVKSGALVGRIFLDQGRIHYALIDDRPELPPVKAIYRMLEWRRGQFELDPPESRQFPAPLDASVQEILMEAFRQQDELTQLRERLPSPESRLKLKTPLEAPLHELDPVQLALLQLALNAPTLAALYDMSPHSDLETGQIILHLLERGYLSAGS
ncbi:MAG: DUF4388 domain-containing protein [Sorangiineae bacterium]|nr:DUF4388 domain-containing protein [Polyangiaceae bacterium]MEB2320910.1 DUF4388 domain-containing protein [Sorangiineae bacterium]